MFGQFPERFELLLFDCGCCDGVVVDLPDDEPLAALAIAAPPPRMLAAASTARGKRSRLLIAFTSFRSFCSLISFE